MTAIERLFDPTEGVCRHRPLFGWSCAVILGSAVGFALGFPWVWLLLATATLWWVWRRQSAESLSAWLCLLLLLLTAWRAGLCHERNARVFGRLRSAQELGQPITLIATVSNDRQVVPRKRGGPYCRFSADDAWFEDGTEIHGINLRFSFYDRAGNFPNTGETWRLVAKPRRHSAYGQLTLSARGEGAEHLPDRDQARHLAYRFADLRNRLAEHLALGVPPDVASQLQTMLLGRRTQLPYDLRQRYTRAGILHLFAISGLHVGIVAGFLIWLLARLGLRLRVRALILAPVLGGYLLLTGLPPSATRACLMAVLYCLAPTLLRRADAPSALFATAAAVLLVEPSWVANVGAILSFTVMGGILLWMAPLRTLLLRLLRVAPSVLAADAPRAVAGLPWHQRWRVLIASLMALTFSAWLAAAPLSLFFFGRLSFVGLLLNLLVPALALAIVWCACLSALSGFLWAPLAIGFNRLGATCLQLLDVCSSLALQLPGATLDLPPMQRPGLTLTLLLELSILVGGLRLRQTLRDQAQAAAASRRQAEC